MISLIVVSPELRRRLLALALLTTLCLPLPPDMAWASDRDRSLPVGMAEKPSGPAGIALPQAKETGLVEDLANEHRKRGLSHANSGRYDLAIEEYNVSLNLDPNQAYTYFNRGFAYAQRASYDRAIEDYNEAVRLYPELASDAVGQSAGDSNADLTDAPLAVVYKNRAYAYYKMGLYDWAIEDATMATHLRPDFPLTYNDRAVFYAAKGEFERAVEDYNKALKLQPGFGPAYANRGHAEFFLGRFEDAARDFQHKLNMDLSDAASQAWLYLALERSGQGAAQKLAKHAASIDLNRWPGPILALFLDHLTPDQVMEKAKQIEGRERSERECEALFYIGQYYLLRGRQEEAERSFQNALTFGFPTFIEHIGAKAELQRMGR